MPLKVPEERKGTGPPSSSTNGSSETLSELSISSVATRKAKFLARWGEKYGYGGKIDELYRSEVGCRLQDHQHYLDYTGSALYCRTPLQAAFNDLQVGRFYNFLLSKK